jgi:DNA-binding CsgD family transcriptional regulator
MVLDAGHDRNAGPPIDLSEREKQVLALVASGERDVDIAENLGISVRTVRSYLDRIRDKTGERRAAGLTKIAIKAGMGPTCDIRLVRQICTLQRFAKAPVTARAASATEGSTSTTAVSGPAPRRACTRPKPSEASE